VNFENKIFILLTKTIPWLKSIQRSKCILKLQ